MELLVLRSSGLDWNCTTSFLWPPAHKAGNGTSQTLCKLIPMTNLYTSIQIPLILFLWRIPTNTDRLELMTFVPKASVLFFTLGHHLHPRLWFIFVGCPQVFGLAFLGTHFSWFDSLIEKQCCCRCFLWADPLKADNCLKFQFCSLVSTKVAS